MDEKDKFVDESNRSTVLFLTFERLGDVFSARDPIFPDRRWIVRPTPKGEKGRLKWELITVMDKIITPVTLADDVVYLFWFAVGKCLQNLAMQGFELSKLYPEEKVNEIRNFFMNLRTRKEKASILETFD